jgi:hypothetical protein
MLANEHLMVGLSAKCPAFGLNWRVPVNYTLKHVPTYTSNTTIFFLFYSYA